MIGRANLRVERWFEVDANRTMVCLEAQLMFKLQVIDLWPSN